MVELRRICYKCNGTGMSTPPPPGEETGCMVCYSTGYLPTTIQVDDLMAELDDMKNKINDVLNKCNDILNKCNDILKEVKP